jgi:hypothetical protein
MTDVPRFTSGGQKLCSTCHKRPRRPGQRTCTICHRVYNWERRQGKTEMLLTADEARLIRELRAGRQATTPR